MIRTAKVRHNCSDLTKFRSIVCERMFKTWSHGKRSSLVCCAGLGLAPLFLRTLVESVSIKVMERLRQVEEPLHRTGAVWRELSNKSLGQGTGYDPTRCESESACDEKSILHLDETSCHGDYGSLNVQKF